MTTAAAAALAEAFVEAVTSYEVTQYNLNTGKQMRARGESMRPGSLAEAETADKAAHAELIAVRDALRRALDALSV